MIVFYLALLVLAGLFLARVTGEMKFPDVTGYLVAGILIGPSVLGIIPRGALVSLDILSNVALAFIAYNIGCEMDYQTLKHLGKDITIITALEAFGAMAAVLIALLAVGESLAFSLILSSIACATAPAATLMIIQQYKAKGEIVNTLIPVVALDDAFCIMAFGMASTVSRTLLSSSQPSILKMLFFPLWEIIFSLLIGIVSGVMVLFISRMFKKEGDLIILMVGVVLMLSFISDLLQVSALLTIMAFGVVVGNFNSRKTVVRTALEGVSRPVLVAFFVLSGAELDLSILLSAGVLGATYFLARALGKYFGAAIGCRITKRDKAVERYLGLTLIPQAGVAIGLSQIASQTFPEPFANTIRTVVLSAVIANEIIGPLLAKYGLKKAGQIAPENL